MASKCIKCGNTENYNFALNIGLCDVCIGEKLEQNERLQQDINCINQLCDSFDEFGEPFKEGGWPFLSERVFEIVTELLIKIKEIEAKNDKYRDALVCIDNWAKAYPLDIFLKPDLKRAAKVLKDAGMTLDAISADAMRHVIDGVKDIVEQALKGN